MAAFRRTLFCLFFQAQIALIHGNIILQDKKSCGSSMEPRIERVKELSRFNVYSHIGKDFYAPNVDCVVTIIGEKFHQWEIVLDNLDIDGHACKIKSPCCNDYLKLFNSYTVDNARLFPTIPWRGLCGNDLPRRTTFRSTQNHVTIQFNSDLLAESKRGFGLTMRQFPKQSAGNDFYLTGFVGGWNDGTLSELQIDWTEQESIPGDFSPGKNPTFEFDPNGIECYNCMNCKKDYFRSSANGVSVQKGCYVCTKEWLQGTALATRQCLSRQMYQERLQTLRDASGGSIQVNDFRSCKTFARGVVGTNYINLCVCDTGKCNSGTLINPSISLILSIATVFIISVVSHVL